MGEWLQFPWRLLIPATFWGCAFAATALGPVLERLAASPGGRLGVALACAVPCALVAPLLRPLFFWNEVPSYRAEELRRVMTNTMTGEYLPLAVDEWPARMSMRAVEIRETGHRFAADSAGASSYVALVEAPAGSRATFDVFDFPGWTVEIDGVPVETASAPPSGLIAWTFDEAGEHEVAVRFGDTPLRAAANGVSLVAWIGCLAWIGTAMRGRRYAEASANRAGENSAHEAQAGSS